MAVKWKVKYIALLAVFAVFLPNVYCDDEEVTISEETVESDDDGEEVVYISPKPFPSAYMMETFDEESVLVDTWLRSEAKKEGVDDDIAKYDGIWAVEPTERLALTGDKGLVLKSKAKHAAISARLKKPFVFSSKPFIVQYEVNLQNGQECGGAYIKLLSAQKNGRIDLKTFHDKTPYTIMFGPDKCGNEFKLHFIFRHVNPLTGEIEEKHAKRPQNKIEEPFKDKKPHLYTLILRPDNSYEILLDHEVVNSGNLLEDFTPPVNPPKEIDDPEDFMPEAWDEREKIPDPEATKPDDWDEDAPMQIPDPDAVKPRGWLDDEAEMIADPAAEKPEDWDDEMDGEWEAALINNPICTEVPGCGEWKSPMIDNPNYKGKWRPEMIDNPNYRGKWKPRRIPNPDYFEDLEPFRMTSIDAVGIELWSMSDNILFDNIIVTDTIADAQQFAQETYDLKIMKMEKGSWKFTFKSWGRWMTQSSWFWHAFAVYGFSPAIIFFIYLIWWNFQPSEIDETTVWGKVLKLTNYKPGLWALYLLYLSIPIGGLLYYLIKRVYEGGLIQRIINYSNKNPWLYAIYTLLVAIPVVLIFACCCMESKDSKEEKEAALKKKTDEPTEDDPLPEGEEGEGDDNEDNKEAVEDGAAGVSEGEKDAEEEGDEEDQEEEEEEEAEAEAEAEEEEEEDGTKKEDAQTRTSPRLRKSRRE